MPNSKELTREDRAVAVLRKHDIVSSTMLVNAGCGYRYGAVLRRLKDRGHTIESVSPSQGPTPEHKSLWWYRLVHDSECKCKSEGPLFCPVPGHVSRAEE